MSAPHSKPMDYPADPLPEAPIEENSPPELRVRGNQLRDANDCDVWLQGLAIPGLEIRPEGHGNLKSTLVGIEEWGANVIRLPIRDSFWYGQGGDGHVQNDGGEAYRALVDAIVVATANRGAYVVLDHHRFRAVRPEHLPFWQEIAERYKNHPAVIFDLINEPHGISWEVWRNGGKVTEKELSQVDESAFLCEEEKQQILSFESPGMQALVDIVRETGARNLIVAGALDWAYDLSGILDGYALDDRGGNGIMYATHVYPWKSGWQKAFIEAAAHYPLLLGEVGADVQIMSFLPLEVQEDPYSWYPDMLGLIQKHKLHWTGWSFHAWATPRMILDWQYTPSPFWGEPAKQALAGKQFPLTRLR